MKKIAFVLVLTLSLLGQSQGFAASLDSTPKDQDHVEVCVNGEFIQLDTFPVLEQNRLLIPIRSLSTLGLTYTWDPSSKSATIQNKEDDILRITVNSSIATKNEETIEMDVPAQNNDGRVFVPIRFVTETLGYQVQYESIRKMVFVTSSDYQFDMISIDQDDLAAARKAAIALPIIADFKNIGYVPGGRDEYSFLVGRADMYVYINGIYNTVVQIKNGEAIALGQYDDNDPSHITGNITPDMFMSDQFVAPFGILRNVLFYENGDGTATVGYTAHEEGDSGRKTTKITVYSDIIQEVPDYQ